MNRERVAAVRLFDASAAYRDLPTIDLRIFLATKLAPTNPESPNPSGSRN